MRTKTVIVVDFISFGKKLINSVLFDVDVASLIMPSSFSSVVLHGRSISTCVKATLHIVNVDFELN